MNKFTPEVGQMAFGNPWAGHSCPDFVIALIEYLAKQSARVDGNVRQTTGWACWQDGRPLVEVTIAGLTWRPYYWGDDDTKKDLPNMAFENVQVSWYKNMGRSMSTNTEQTPAEWVAWFDRALEALRKADTR